MVCDRFVVLFGRWRCEKIQRRHVSERGLQEHRGDGVIIPKLLESVKRPSESNEMSAMESKKRAVEALVAEALVERVVCASVKRPKVVDIKGKEHLTSAFSHLATVRERKGDRSAARVDHYLCVGVWARGGEEADRFAQYCAACGVDLAKAHAGPLRKLWSGYLEDLAAKESLKAEQAKVAASVKQPPSAATTTEPEGAVAFRCTAAEFAQYQEWRNEKAKAQAAVATAEAQLLAAQQRVDAAKAAVVTPARAGRPQLWEA